MTELLRPRETRATTAGLAAAAELHANRAESPNRKVTACIADAAHLLALLLLSMYIPLDARETCHVKFDGHRNALFFFLAQRLASVVEWWFRMVPGAPDGGHASLRGWCSGR